MAQTFDADVRYGSSFLSVDNHRHSVPGEIMTNKVTGEVYLKRPGDGKIISFRQKSHTLYEAIQEFNIQFQSSVGFTHPEYPGSYLLGTKFLADEFEPDENKKDILKEYHEFSKNDYKYKDFIFEVSGDTNGFYLKPITRLGDRNICGFLSGMFREQEFSEFNGLTKTFEDWLLDNPKYNDSYLYTEWKQFGPEWTSSNALVDCEIKTTGMDNVGNILENKESFTVPINFNEFSYVGFPEEYKLGMEKVMNTTVTIKRVYSPKLEYERFLADEPTAASGVNGIVTRMMDLDNRVVLQSIDLFYFISSSVQLPTCEHMIIDQCVDVEFLDKAIVYLATSSGARAFQSQVNRPEAFPIDTVWAEEIRDVNSEEEVVVNPTETTFEQIEETLYFETEKRAKFTIHSTHADDLLITDKNNGYIG